jgi:hypothetical protein
MLATLKEMYAKTAGFSASLPFESFLGEILENAAAEFRAQQWRSEHPHEEPKPERKAWRVGKMYANAASECEDEEASA